MTRYLLHNSRSSPKNKKIRTPYIFHCIMVLQFNSIFLSILIWNTSQNFAKWENWGLENLDDLTRVTLLVDIFWLLNAVFFASHEKGRKKRACIYSVHKLFSMHFVFIILLNFQNNYVKQVWLSSPFCMVREGKSVSYSQSQS